MRDQRHVIRCQVLEVTAADEATARQLHAELARIQREYLEAIIDRACTELCAPDRIHRIDSLVVDLGRVDMEHLERDVAQKLDTELRHALAEHLRDGERRAGEDGDTRVSSRLELVAFFTRTAALPWWADASMPHLVDESVGFLIAHAAGPLTELIRQLAGDRRALSRLVLHCDDERLAALFVALVSTLRTSAAPELEELRALLRTHEAIVGALPARFRRAVWEAALVTLFGEASRGTEPVRFWRELLARVATAMGASYRALLMGLERAHGQTRAGPPGGLGAVAQSLLREMPPDDSTPARDAPRQPARDVPRQEEAARALEAVREQAPLDLTDGDLTYGDSGEVYVENAGLVVLWPFLGHFFEHLGLVVDQKMKDPAALHRAVGLLQFVATEDPSPPEYQLPLAKVLCGMGAGELFELPDPISDAEAEECRDLLRAVIAHAPILNDMSIAGFRGTFLLRKGVLGVRDGAWLLRVVRAAYDVVLDRFPWSTSWVKLPWMEAPLYVEW